MIRLPAARPTQNWISCGPPATTVPRAAVTVSALSLCHIDPDFAFWTTSGEFVFLAILSGYVSVTAVFVAAVLLELVRSFSSQYFPNTWQGALGVFLMLIILFLPDGLGSLMPRLRPGAKGAPAPAGKRE